MAQGGDKSGRQEGSGGRVVNEVDYLHAELHGFKRRVAQALSTIKNATQKGKIGISYSGGKDSTVLLDLVRRVVPGAPAAFFDCGCNLSQTYEIVAHYNVTIIKPRLGLLEMCRRGGYWGYEGSTNSGAKFNFGRVLIDEPARQFAREYGLSVHAIGLRAEESSGRAANAHFRGTLYFANYMDAWHLCPLQRWTTDDIWAYIANRELRYNSAYDAMHRMGMPRERQRIDMPLGSAAATIGRFAIIKQIDIELWNRLAAEFPNVRKYT